jgi:hypothetical protein
MSIRCRFIICKEADREEMALRFYQLKGAQAVEITYQQKLKALEEENKSDAATIAKLQLERDQAKAGAEKAAAELAKNQSGQGSEMYQEAVRLYLDGKIDAAIALLDDDKLRRSAETPSKVGGSKPTSSRSNSDLRRLRKPMKRHSITSIVKLIRGSGQRRRLT